MALLDEVKVKLGVPKEGGAILFRRIDLSRYGGNLSGNGPNGGGKAIYKNLKLLAVQSATSSHDMPQAACLNRYQVTLHYTDVDGDECMIGSVAELKDALKMFSDKGFVKIVADVYEKEQKQPTSSGTAKAVAAATTTTESVETATQTGEEDAVDEEEEVEVPPIPSVNVNHSHPNQQNQLQNVVDTIVGAIGPAINSIRLVAAEAEQKAAEAASRASYVAANENSNKSRRPSCQKPAPTAAAAATAATKVTESEEETPKANDKVEEPKTKSAPPRPPAATAVPTTVTTSNEEPPRPFIHGRHTCDGCLTTPIVGNRWHATNMADYDLCHKCKTTYKGDEIQFEKVTLERDEPFQERWNRRRAKWVNRGGPHRHRQQPRVCNSRGMRPRRQWGPPGCPRPAPHAGPSPDEVDFALKEAIRRSLQDYKADAPAKSDEEEKKETTIEPAKKEEKASEVKDEEEPAEDKKQEEEEEEEVVEESTAQKSVSADANESEKKPADLPAVVDTTIPIIVDDDEKKPPASAKEPPVDEEDEKKKPPPQAGNAVPAKIATAVARSVMKAAVAASAANRKKKDPPRTEANSSFESEAEGVGSVAGILGATLDKVADAIDAFNHELERNEPSSEEADEGSDDEEQEDEEEIIVEPVEEEIVVEPEAPADSPAEADVIIDGEEEEEPAAAVSNDDDSTSSWVIPEENQEQFARAAEVIGSALFHSGMTSEDHTANSGAAEGGTASSAGSSSSSSSSSSGDSFSSVGSVPTSVPSAMSPSVMSNVTAAQTERWALQLQQLHELGFHDDALLVDVIERLHAANIGVDSSDEVTVQQVVDELFNKNK